MRKVLTRRNLYANRKYVYSEERTELSFCNIKLENYISYRVYRSESQIPFEKQDRFYKTRNEESSWKRRRSMRMWLYMGETIFILLQRQVITITSNSLKSNEAKGNAKIAEDRHE